MKKADAMKIIQAVRKRSENNKENVTFRLDKDIVNEFRRYCEDNDIKMGPVLEELLKSLLDAGE